MACLLPVKSKEKTYIFGDSFSFGILCKSLLEDTDEQSSALRVNPAVLHLGVLVRASDTTGRACSVTVR